MIKRASVGNSEVIYAYIGDTKIYELPYPLTLLTEENIGLWWRFDDINSLSQTVDTFTPVKDQDPIGYVYDQGMHKIDGRQPVTAYRLTYNSDMVLSDMVDDGLSFSLPNAMNPVYMLVDNELGVNIYKMSLPSNNSLISRQTNGRYIWYNTKNIFISANLTESNIDKLEIYFQKSKNKITDFSYMWNTSNYLIEFPLVDTSSGTDFRAAWNYCSSLKSFPLIDTSSGTDFSSGWAGCRNLESFPPIDTSSGTNFNNAWYGCSKLTEFPLIDTSSGIIFNNTWDSCRNLESFPLIDTSSGTNFSSAWQSCDNLKHISPGMFDNIKGGNFRFAFNNTNLTEQSIDNILTSLVASNISDGLRNFHQSGGSAPSVTIGQPAIDTLRARGWDITVTGGY